MNTRITDHSSFERVDVGHADGKSVSRMLRSLGFVCSVLLAAAPAAAQFGSSGDIDSYLGCPGFDEAFRADMARLLSSRAPQPTDLDWHVRGAPFTSESHVVVESITVNGRAHRVEHPVATCDELASFVLSFVERDLDAHPPVSVAFFVSLFPDIGSTPAVTFGSRIGLQLDVDRFAVVVQAGFALPQSGPIAPGFDTTLSSSSLLGRLIREVRGWI